MKTETQVGLFIVVAIAIFFYLSLNIGAFRLDGPSYFYYKVFSEDTGGLEAKAHIKIAGVTVGWVENISLMDNGLAEIIIRVNRQYKLFRNAYAKISQDGLLGSKTLEIDPGDPSSGVLAPGSNLSVPGKSSATVADVIESFKEITSSVQDVISSFQNVFATPEGEQKIAKTLDKTVEVGHRLAKFSHELQSMTKENRARIDEMCNNLVDASKEIQQLTEKISEKGDEIKDNLFSTTESFRSGAEKFDKTLANTEKISQKIADGEGSLGKLVNDESLFYDVKDTVSDVKNLVGKASALEISLDLNYASYYHTDNARGFTEIKIATQSDWFYSLQLASDRIGKLVRKTYYNHFYDEENNKINTMDKSFNYFQRTLVPAKREKLTRTVGEFQLGFQFCKKFSDLTLKVGLFDGTAGFAADYDFILKFKTFRWITRLEAFDFSGYNRIEKDVRPHVRWSNRIFFIKSFYTYFGFDDLFSKQQASFFWGAGFCFDDNDVKYLLSLLPLKSIAG